MVLRVDVGQIGKEQGLPRPYPVVCHLLDTAAVMGVLVAVVLSPRRKAVLAEALGIAPEFLPGLLQYWAALHDIGKISPAFQCKFPDNYQQLLGSGRYGQPALTEEDRGFHHSEATQWILADLFSRQGYPQAGRRPAARGAHQVAQLLGGHHGRFHEALMDSQTMADPRARHPAALGLQEDWGEQCEAHAAAVQAVLGPGASVAPAAGLPTELAVLVAGLVVVADWLASQEHFLLPRLPEPGWSGEDAQLRVHFARACGEAPTLVAEAGLGPARFRAVAPGVEGFRERFPKASWEPNQLQASLASDLEQVATGPGLLLIAAPAGDGKTEAAAHSAAHLARVSGMNGMAFALPTMATTDAMFRRVRSFAEDNLDSPASLALMHGMSWLNSDFESLVEQSQAGSDVVTEGHDAVFSAQWLRGSRRGVLASLAAMTIDQVLVGVLPVKHNALRMLGLADKVLVIDEAHSYGPWMHQLLLGLLEWLGALGAPVVVMSATLAGRTARSVLEAYRRGCGHDDRVVLPDLPYPGWMFLDAASGRACTPRRFGSDRQRLLRVEMVPVTRASAGTEAPQAAGAPQDRLEVIAERLRVLPGSAGGRVLVCCNTVAEAQVTFHHLRERFEDRGVDVLLLHSRFEAVHRDRITKDCERRFGKDTPTRGTGAAVEANRPVILVATQIVEQSIDLDFDLMISDLAPIALLIQRAGRCQRHDRDDRPDWAGSSPLLVVLEPVDAAGAFQRPRAWGWVYSQSLLLRTSHLLRDRAARPLDIPGDVQGLVDAVYADDFTSGLDHAVKAEHVDLLATLHLEDQAEEAAEKQLAAMVCVDSPREVANLALLSGKGGQTLLDDRLVVTRLGADSVRLLPVYEWPDGPATLDPDREIELPRGRAPKSGSSGTGGPRLGKEGLRTVLGHAVPAPGTWTAGVSAEARKLPSHWGNPALLRDLLLVRGTLAADGTWQADLGPRALSYDAVMGLRTR